MQAEAAHSQANSSPIRFQGSDESDSYISLLGFEMCIGQRRKEQSPERR
jgi:hypothetical protein